MFNKGCSRHEEFSIDELITVTVVRHAIEIGQRYARDGHLHGCIVPHDEAGGWQWACSERRGRLYMKRTLMFLAGGVAAAIVLLNRDYVEDNLRRIATNLRTELQPLETQVTTGLNDLARKID